MDERTLIVLLPEIVLGLGVLAHLSVELAYSGQSHRFTEVSTGITVIGALAALFSSANIEAGYFCNSMFVHDGMTVAVRACIFIGLLFTVLLFRLSSEDREDDKSDFHVAVLMLAIGSSLFLQARVAWMAGFLWFVNWILWFGAAVHPKGSSKNWTAIKSLRPVWITGFAIWAWFLINSESLNTQPHLVSMNWLILLLLLLPAVLHFPFLVYFLRYLEAGSPANLFAWIATLSTASVGVIFRQSYEMFANRLSETSDSRDLLVTALSICNFIFSFTLLKTRESLQSFSIILFASSFVFKFLSLVVLTPASIGLSLADWATSLCFLAGALICGVRLRDRYEIRNWSQMKGAFAKVPSLSLVFSMMLMGLVGLPPLPTFFLRIDLLSKLFAMDKITFGVFVLLAQFGLIFRVLTHLLPVFLNSSDERSFRNQSSGGIPVLVFGFLIAWAGLLFLPEWCQKAAMSIFW